VRLARSLRGVSGRFPVANGPRCRAAWSISTFRVGAAGLSAAARGAGTEPLFRGLARSTAFRSEASRGQVITGSRYVFSLHSSALISRNLGKYRRNSPIQSVSGDSIYTEPLERDKQNSDRLPFAGTLLANGRCRCRMSLAGYPVTIYSYPMTVWVRIGTDSSRAARIADFAWVLVLLPVFPVERAVLHRLGDVFGLDLFASAQVGDGTGDLQDAVVSAGRQGQTPDGHFERLLRGGVQWADVAQASRGHGRSRMR